MRILITGITGFAGSHMAELALDKGVEVFGTYRWRSRMDNIHHLLNKVGLIECDLRDAISVRNALKEAKPDWIFHLAAQSYVPTSWSAPGDTMHSNIIGTVNLFEAVRQLELGCRIQVAGSSVTGDTPVLIERDGEIALVPIRQLIGQRHFRVLSVDRDYRVRFLIASSVWSHGVKPVLAVKVNGNTVIKMTADHSVMVLDKDGRLVSKAAGDLKVGDYLVTFCGRVGERWESFDLDLSRYLSGRERQQISIRQMALSLREGGMTYAQIARRLGISYATVHRWLNKPQNGSRLERTVANPVPVRHELMRLCGYYLAEGSLDLASLRAQWTFGIHEPEKAKDTATLCESAVGARAVTISEPQWSRITVRASSKRLTLLLASFGKNAHEKHLPSWVWRLPPEHVFQLLLGYMGDGHQRPEGAVWWTSVNRWLLVELLWLLRMNDLSATLMCRRIKEHPSPQGLLIKESVCHDLHAPVAEVAKFMGKPAKSSRWRQPMSRCIPTEIFKPYFFGKGIWRKVGRKRLISKERAVRLAEQHGITLPPHLERLLRSPLGVARIKAIEPAGEEEVFDISVPGAEMFFGGEVPILLHNSEEYGLQHPEELPIKETNELRPLSPYAVSKVAQDLSGFQYHKSYGMFIVRTRAFNHSVGRYTPILLRDDLTGLMDIRYIGELQTHMGVKTLPNGSVVWDLNRHNLSVWANGKWSKIRRLYCHPLNGDKLLRVVSSGGIVEVTGDHSIIASNGMGPEVMHARDLLIGDRLTLVPLPNSERIFVHEEVAWFLGFFVAEGKILKSKLSIKIGNTQKHLLKRCREILLTHFGKDSYIKEERDGLWTLIVRKPWGFARWLKPQVYASDGNKRVPMSILNAQRSAKLAFLEGYNAGEGLQQGQGTYAFKNFKTKSPILAMGLCYLITATTKQIIYLNTEVRDGRVYYSLNLNPDKEDHAKSGKPLEIPEGVVKKVQEVAYEGEVWDFETEDGTFHAGIGHCLVHNSGPRRPEQFVDSGFAWQIARIEAGLQEPVIYVGNLEAKRDFTDVRDIVRAYWLALEKGEPGEVYNIASGKAWSIREVLDMLLSMTEVQVEMRPDPARMRPSDVPVLVGDASKFKARTGWQPQIPYEQTLRDMLDYWRARFR